MLPSRLLNGPGDLTSDPGLKGILGTVGAGPDSEVDGGGELARAVAMTLVVDLVLRQWRSWVEVPP